MESEESDINVTVHDVNTETDDTSQNLNSFVNAIHEALRRYESEYLQSLLQDNHNDVQTIDEYGRSYLHVLLQDEFQGHLNEIRMTNCVKILIDHNIYLNNIDQFANTPLSLAVTNRFPNCILLLLNSGAHSSLKLSIKIARYMPDVFLKLLNSSISIEQESDGNTTIKLDWRQILQFHKESPTPKITKWSNPEWLKIEQKESEFLHKLLSIKSDVRQKYFNHPIIQAFVYLKYAQMPKRFKWFFMVCWLLCPLLYVIFISYLYFKHCGFEDIKHDDDASTSTSTTVPIRVQPRRETCDHNIYITAWAIILFGINFCLGFYEINMGICGGFTYLFNGKRIISTLAIGFMVASLCRILFTNDTIYIRPWEPLVANVGIFLACVMFLIQLGLLNELYHCKLIPIYLEILVMIIKSVMKILGIFSPLFIGFFIGFKLLFSNMNGWFEFFMLTIDSSAIDFDNQADTDIHNNDKIRLWQELFCAVFIIVIVIIFFNLLMAVSIRDLEKMKGYEKLARISRRIQTIFMLDVLYPNSLLVNKDDLKNGNTYYKYNPKAAIQELPVHIRRNILLLLKERNNE